MSDNQNKNDLNAQPEEKVEGNGQLNAQPQDSQEDKNFMTHFYIALGCFAVGCILLVLAIVFTFVAKNGTGVYFLISSMIGELASVSFLNAMKQRGGEGKLRTVFVILSYVVMGVALAIFVAGTGASIFAKTDK